MESRKNGNRSVQCKVCSKYIRSDHVKRHMGTHKDIMAMTDEEAREELRTRHATELHREERRQEIKEIAFKKVSQWTTYFHHQHLYYMHPN